MSEPTLTIQAKIFKVVAYICLGVGLIFFMLAISSLFMGGSPPFLDIPYLFIFGFSLILAGSFLLVAAQQGIIKPEFTTLTLLKCTNTPDCKYRKARKFEENDFVFKELEETCETCGGKLYIAAILEVEKKSKQKKVPEEKPEEALQQIEPTAEPTEKSEATQEKNKEESKP